MRTSAVANSTHAVSPVLIVVTLAFLQKNKTPWELSFTLPGRPGRYYIRFMLARLVNPCLRLTGLHFNKKTLSCQPCWARKPVWHPCAILALVRALEPVRPHVNAKVIRLNRIQAVVCKCAPLALPTADQCPGQVPWAGRMYLLCSGLDWCKVRRVKVAPVPSAPG